VTLRLLKAARFAGLFATIGCHAASASSVQTSQRLAPAPPATAVVATAAPKPTPLRITSLTTGSSHTCVRLSDATLRCWGEGWSGALGYPEPADIGDDEGAVAAPAVPVGGPVTSVVAGRTHTCALLEDGRVRCWGRWSAPESSPPTDVDVGAPAVELAAGFSHTCARTASGGVRCWGRNNEGQLGDGLISKHLPAPLADVSLPSPARHVWVGEQGTCASLENGSLSCWGLPWVSYGSGRTQRLKGQASPATVDVGGAVKQVVFGGSHACALLEDGAIRCWGYGPGLGLGNVTIGDDEPPSAVRPLYVGGVATALAAGYAHTCALLSTGAVRCWGDSQLGVLGYGNRVDIGDDESPAAAGDVPLGGKATQIAAGGFHTCALLQNGALRCWGDGRGGPLGYGNPNPIGDDETPQDAGDVPLFTPPRPPPEPTPRKSAPNAVTSLVWEEPSSAPPPPTCGEPCRGCKTLYDSTQRLPSSTTSLTRAEQTVVRRVYEQYIYSEECQNDERHLDPLALGSAQDNGHLSDVVAGSFTAPGRKQKLVLFFAGHCGELGNHSENWGQRLLILLEDERALTARIDTSTSSLSVVDLDNDGRSELVTSGGWTGGGGSNGSLAVQSFAGGEQRVIERFPEISSSSCSSALPNGEEVEGKVLYRVEPVTRSVCFLARKRTSACPKR
jgi:alpha-tubulin suppressor-like RCC1 family protein